ncbi:hypothetical protein MRX96_057972 [Rhipicephalus microplus]
MALNMILAVLSGLTLYAVYGRCDPRLTGDIRKADQLMPYIIQDLLYEYPGLCGLMAAAVYSSSLSTLSSGYNSLAAVTWEDFLRPCVKTSESSALRITKVTAATYGLLSMSIAFLVGTMESIMQVALIVTTWMALGSILYPRRRHALPTTTEGCSHFNETITSGSFDPPPHPSGINQLYHISFMWFRLRRIYRTHDRRTGRESSLRTEQVRLCGSRLRVSTSAQIHGEQPDPKERQPKPAQGGLVSEATGESAEALAAIVYMPFYTGIQTWQSWQFY